MKGHQPAAGVGTAAKQHTAYKLIDVPLNMEASKIYYTAGRLSKHRLVVPGAHYLVYNRYGYTNSHTDPAQRAKNRRLFDAVLAERAEDGLIPAALLGDFNCELQDIPAIYDLIQEGKYLDIATLATEEEQGNMLEGTCRAHGAACRTRRDYILLDRVMASKVGEAWVERDAGFDVHNPMGLSLIHI